MVATIKKTGAIILNDEGALLIVKPYKLTDIWIFVGGKIEDGESREESLVREVREELGVGILGKPEFYMESPIELAAGDPKKRTIQIFAYFVSLAETPAPSKEIEELHWLTRTEFEGSQYTLGSILRDHTIPRLIRDGLMK